VLSCAAQLAAVQIMVQTKHEANEPDQFVRTAFLFRVVLVNRTYRQPTTVFDEYLLKAHFEFVQILFSVEEGHKLAVNYAQ
jgi:hypothetical protein